MDNTIYLAVSRQTALMRQMDVIANNIANLDTTGYRAERMLFKDYVVNAGRENEIAFSQDVASVLDTSQGEIRATHRKLDVAINGEGFFAVDTPLGERYTRVGSFQVAGDGSLVTPEGYKVKGAGGAIQLQPDDVDIRIGEDGTILIGAGGDTRGRINVVNFDNQQSLKRHGNGLYESEAAPRQATADEYALVQGALEKSNVVSVKELTALIQTSRSTGTTQKIISDMHNLERRTIQTLARQNPQ